MQILLAILAVVGLLAVAYFFLKKKDDALPPGDEPRGESPTRAAPPETAAAAKPKADKPAEASSEGSPADDAETDKAPDAAQATAGGAQPSQAQLIEAQPDASQPLARTATPEEVAALREGLGSTRGGFIAKLASLFKRKKEVDPELLEEMEELLITADIGVQTTDKILTRLRAAMENGTIADGDAAWAALREHAFEILARPESGGLRATKTPTVILVIGVNGVGKTTTIGKLASRLKEDGKTVLLAAGDTFRAAAVLQLEVWGRRVGCEVVKGKDRADPGSVIFDAIKKGTEMGADVIIADTAGRLHTKSPLMDELQKVGRTAEKALGREADEVLLVLDSTTGQNAGQQAALFKEALPVSGLVLTKLDGTAKGGVILGIVDEHELPVRYVGIGERVEDLKEFDPRSFVDALFAPPEEGTPAS